MIEMDCKKWNEKIKNNFNDAAYQYLEHSNIQKFFAKKIVRFIKELNPQKKGEWIDLGSGPGLLADEIEKKFPSHKVSRIDFSKKMLLENKLSRKKILWDLNNDLPPEINNCSLLTSNFCIHWLNNPEKVIKNWFSKLTPGGFLIISYPTKHCFPEWKDTCKKILWDLNNDLPAEINNCSLITSNFCIHWLNNPEKIIKKWFSKLIPGGFLIISYPTKGCFPEWKDTCRKIDIEYSGLSFICSKELLKNFKSNEIYCSEKFIYLENFEDVYKLFRSLINVGAQSTISKRKTVKELKEIQKFWPKNYNNRVNLSWEIDIQIIKKL